MGDTAGLMAASQGISTGANAFSSLSTSYLESQAIREQGNYQKNQLQFNAQVARLQSEDAKLRGEKEASKKKKETKQMIGAQRAALAAQGIEINEDTALLIQEDTAGIGAQDVATIRNNAWREAWGYDVQALDYTGQANMAQTASKFKAKQTMLTGGLQAAREIGAGAERIYKAKKG